MFNAQLAKTMDCMNWKLTWVCETPWRFIQLTFRALALRQSKQTNARNVSSINLHGVWHTHINFQLIQFIVLLVSPTQINTIVLRGSSIPLVALRPWFITVWPQNKKIPSLHKGISLPQKSLKLQFAFGLLIRFCSSSLTGRGRKGATRTCKYRALGLECVFLPWVPNVFSLSEAWAPKPRTRKPLELRVVSSWCFSWVPSKIARCPWTMEGDAWWFLFRPRNICCVQWMKRRSLTWVNFFKGDSFACLFWIMDFAVSEGVISTSWRASPPYPAWEIW